MNDLLARAREMLADAYEEGGWPRIAKAVRRGDKSLASEVVCRAMVSALSTLPDAVAGEREAILRFVRSEAQMRYNLAGEHPTLDGTKYNHTRAIALEMAADAIERGDHLAAIRKEPAS